MVRGKGGAEGGDVELTFVISVAAELAGMHPQTLRQYDRLGLVTPARTKGRGRRYSSRDVQQLREIQRLSQDEGINLAGIQRILDLQRRVDRLEAERDLLRRQLAEVEERRDRIFAASASGEVRPMRRGQRTFPEGGAGGEVTLWRGHPLHEVAPRRVRAVIEAGPAGVRVLEGTVTVVEV